MMEREIVLGSLNEVTRRLWEGSLTYRVHPLVSIPVPTLDLPNLGAIVQISGAWQGAVLLQTTPELARDVACVMFDLDRTSEAVSATPANQRAPSDAMVIDSLKEIANITAGNLKTALPEPCALSIPEAKSFTSWDGPETRSSVFTELSFRCENCLLEGAFFRISLLKNY